MIVNYLKIAFRNLWRHRVFSLLNIMGLTVGMTAFFLVFSYIRFELGYNAFHSKADRIYRIAADIYTPTDTIHSSGPAWAVPPNLKDEFPEVEHVTRVLNDDMLVRKGDIKFQEGAVLFADSNFFDIFDFKLIKGNPKTALKSPLNVVLTETAAKKYFGKQDPVGQTMILTGDNHAATVTGLLKDMPENSSIKGDMIVSMSTITEKFSNGSLDSQWGNYGPMAYALLKYGTNPDALAKKIPAFLERRNGSEMKALQMVPIIILEPLKRMYLYSTRETPTPAINNVYIFSSVGIFILLIAAINFINLTTARSTERAKEVGIRKVVGAERGQLTRQFLGESILICLIAFILAVGAAALLIPLFNELSGKVISEGILDNGTNIGILFLAALAIGAIAGLYPALVLSGFKPISVLKGRFSSGTKGVLLRKSLVVAQFTISIALIIGTIVVYTQMKYMRNQELGFNKDQVLVVDSKGDPGKNAFRESVAALSSVTSTAWSGSVPGGGNPGAYSQIENFKGDMQISNLNLYFVDFDFISTYNIQLAAGRAFSKEMKTDTTDAMMINEAALANFGFKTAKEAVGKKFDQWGRKGLIIGVTKNFHYRSLQQNIEPLSMRIEPGAWGMLSIHLKGGNIAGSIKTIEEKWKAAIPNRPFTYFFLDEFFDQQYRTEDRFGRLFFNFAILAIFISCLGLLGLASYSTMQRTREIGIRKVMGASVSGIVNLLSKDFLRLVLLSFVIAAPLAWFFMRNWLKDFAYRIDMQWWMFVLSVAMAIVIAAVTISFQAVKAALANPVKSLRTE